jgi:hypothetical protein
MVLDDVVTQLVDVQEAHLAKRTLVDMNVCITHVLTESDFALDV